MRPAFAAQCDACRLDPPADFAIKAHHGDVGRASANKDFPHISFRAAVPEVIDQRLPDGLKQRQPRMITGFGAADVQSIAAPIDIFQSQPAYFTGTQAIDRQKLEDGMVAQAHRRPVFSDKFQDGRDLIRT